jgi:hypothetical protein
MLPCDFFLTLWADHNVRKSSLFMDSSPTNAASGGSSACRPASSLRFPTTSKALDSQSTKSRRAAGSKEGDPGPVPILRGARHPVAEECGGRAVPGQHTGAAAPHIRRVRPPGSSGAPIARAARAGSAARAAASAVSAWRGGAGGRARRRRAGAHGRSRPAPLPRPCARCPVQGACSTPRRPRRAAPALPAAGPGPGAAGRTRGIPRRPASAGPSGAHELAQLRARVEVPLTAGSRAGGAGTATGAATGTARRS